jgi:cystathionine beta-lyase/cystathionine gamma-synthase
MAYKKGDKKSGATILDFASYAQARKPKTLEDRINRLRHSEDRAQSLLKQLEKDKRK